MIIHQLRKFKRESVFGGTSQTIDFAASLIIESGALYLVPAIAHFVVWWTQDDFAINLVSDIVSYLEYLLALVFSSLLLCDLHR